MRFFVFLFCVRSIGGRDAREFLRDVFVSTYYVAYRTLMYDSGIFVECYQNTYYILSCSGMFVERSHCTYYKHTPHEHGYNNKRGKKSLTLGGVPIVSVLRHVDER